MIFKVNSLHLSCLWGDGLAFQPRLLSLASCFNHRLLAGRFSGFWSDSEIWGAPPRRSSLRTLHAAHDLIAERTRSLSCSVSFSSFASSWKTKWLQSWNMWAIIFSSSACHKETNTERRRAYATGVCVGDNTCGRVSTYSIIASLKSFLIPSCRGNTG